VPQYTGSSSIIPLNQQTTGGTQAMTPLTAQGTGSRMMPNIPSRPSNLGLGAQMTGGSPFPLARSPAAAQIPWDVTAEEKARNDGFFDSLDIAKAGYIEGAAAVPFMLLSNLPEDSLARIWYVKFV
jgi:epidermal growth factor receptor substrate 15